MTREAELREEIKKIEKEYGFVTHESEMLRAELKGITETKNNILKYIEIVEREEKSPMIILKRIKRSLK